MKGDTIDGACLGTIFFITDDGVTQFLGGVYTYLVFASGVEGEFRQCASGATFEHFVSCDGRFAVTLFPGGIYLKP